MKYYFVTYRATTKHGRHYIVNYVIDVSPMKFIKEVEASDNGQLFDYLIINALEISKDEFDEFSGQFG